MKCNTFTFASRQDISSSHCNIGISQKWVENRNQHHHHIHAENTSQRTPAQSHAEVASFKIVRTLFRRCVVQTAFCATLSCLPLVYSCLPRPRVVATFDIFIPHFILWRNRRRILLLLSIEFHGISTLETAHLDFRRCISRFMEELVMNCRSLLMRFDALSVGRKSQTNKEPNRNMRFVFHTSIYKVKYQFCRRFSFLKLNITSVWL